MTNFLKSDLTRNFLGGFLIGAIALITLQPSAERTDMGKTAGSLISELKDRIA
ncbi:MAG: hypothetical protein R3E02_07080 [Blastomonas sp.]